MRPLYAWEVQHMKVIIAHKYQYFTVHRVWARENTLFKWSHRPDDGASTGQASYYKGKLKTIAALNPLVVGLTCEGHYEWSDRASYPEYWTKVGEWQHCIPSDGDIEWWCLHANDPVPLSVKYLPLVSSTVIEPDTSVFVLQGSALIIECGRQLAAYSMVHIKPRPHTYTIDGDAKLWFIRKAI